MKFIAFQEHGKQRKKFWSKPGLNIDWKNMQTVTAGVSLQIPCVNLFKCIRGILQDKHHHLNGIWSVSITELW